MSGIMGSMSGGMTSYYTGKEQWHQARREMGYKEIQSAEEVRQMENELAQLEGTQRAGYGASGVKMEGSPMDVMLATEREGRHEIEYKQMMDRFQVMEIRRAGRLAKKAGQMALWGGIAGAVGSAIETAYSFGQSSGSASWGGGSLNSAKMKNPSSGGYSTHWSLLGNN